MHRTDLSAEDRAVLHRLISRLGDGAIKGAEIGVACGETSAWLLATFPNLHLTMVDAWAEYGVNHPYRQSGDGCAKLTTGQQSKNRLAAMAATEGDAERRVILWGDSVAMAQQVPALTLDFAFIDGDHTLSGVRRDLMAWYGRVRNGGLFVGHDVDHPRDRRGVWGVRRAVEEFGATMVEPVEGGYREPRLHTEARVWWFEPFG